MPPVLPSKRDGVGLEKDDTTLALTLPTKDKKRKVSAVTAVSNMLPLPSQSARKSRRKYPPLPLVESVKKELEEAQKFYLLLSTSGKDFDRACIELCGDNDRSRRLRGLLLGNEGATVSELWLEKIQHDTSCCGHLHHLASDPATGTPGRIITKHMYNSGPYNSNISILLLQFEPILEAKFALSKHIFLRNDVFIGPVISNLFGLATPQSAYFQYQSGGLPEISSDQIEDMIRYCVKRCPINSDKVSKHIAQAAYKQIVVLGHEDLKGNTMGFGQKLADMCVEACNEGHFGEIEAEEKETWKKTMEVESKTIMGYPTTMQEAKEPGNNKVPLFEVSVVHDFAPPSFKKTIIKEMNELEFMVGSKGKSNAYIRNCSSLDNPAPFTVGKATVYAGKHASPIEKRLLRLANFICKSQEKYVLAETEGKGYQVTFAANQLLTVVATLREALFSPHSDYSARLCSPDGVDRQQSDLSDLWLPRREELQVLTYVLSNSSSRRSTELVYLDDTGHTLGSVPLSSFCIHHQGAGSQAPGIKHAAKVLNGAREKVGSDGEPTIWRLHLTCRYTLDPIKQQDEFQKQIMDEMQREVPLSEYKQDYNQTQVISKVISDSASPCLDGAPTGEELNNKGETTVGSTGLKSTANRVDLGSTENRDTYTNLTHEEYDKLKMFRCKQTMEFVGPLAQHCETAAMTRALFDEGILVQVQKTVGQPPVPVLHQVRTPATQGATTTVGKFPMIGDRMTLQNIASKADVVHNIHSSPILNPNTDGPVIIILSQPYKNDKKEFPAFKDRLVNWLAGDRKEPLFTDDFDGVLTIYGSGGSPTTLGDHPANYNKDKKTDSGARVPFSQDFDNPINKGLRHLAERNAIVALYVIEEKMFPDNVNVSPSVGIEHCTFWGMFVASSFIIEVDDELEVVSENINESDVAQKFARFRLVPHAKLRLTPLFNNKQLEKLMENPLVVCENYKVMTVHQDCKEKFVVDMPTGGQVAAMSLGVARITHKTLYSQFVEQRRYIPFLTDIVSDEEGGQDVEEFDDIDQTEEAFCGLSKVTAAGMGICAALVNASAAARFLKQSLEEPTKPDSRAIPLGNVKLPASLQETATPAASRPLDLNCNLGRETALSTSDLYQKTNTPARGARVLYKDGLFEDLLDILFQASIVRFTGRTARFRTYARETEALSLIPRRSHIARFLSFMERTIQPNNKKRSIGQWLSQQHKNCIPKSTHTFGGFSLFATQLAKNLEEVGQDMLRATDRKDAVSVLHQLLLSLCNDGNSRKLHWLAQEIVSDVDEIFDYAFGVPVAGGIVEGHGSKIGHGFVCLAEGDKSFGEGLQDRVNCVQRMKNKLELDLLGLEIGPDTIIVHKINGRPYDASDAEHEFCKLYQLGKLTFGHFSNSKHPRSAKAWCHPEKLHTLDILRKDTQVQTLVKKVDVARLDMLLALTDIMESIDEAYRKCSGSDAPDDMKLILPELCLRPGEAEWNRERLKKEQEDGS